MNDPDLTIFTTCPDFVGHRGVIQKNAIKSWRLLGAGVLLIGRAEGRAAVAQELGAELVEDVVLSASGSPYADSMIAAAEAMNGGRLLSYVASDVILTPDFVEALKRVPFSRFLLIGRRRHLKVESALEFGPRWVEEITARARKRGSPGLPSALDYMVFTPGAFGRVPPFIVGRMAWENAIVFNAKRAGVTLIDASKIVSAIHQNHDYLFLPAGEYKGWGPETAENLRLLASPNDVADIRDAAFILTANRLRRTHFRKARRNTRELFRTRFPSTLRATRHLVDWALGRGLII